jgi:hypothetical protein
MRFQVSGFIFYGYYWILRLNGFILYMDPYYITVNGFILNGFTLYDATIPSTSSDVTTNTRGLKNDFAPSNNCDTASKQQ